MSALRRLPVPLLAALAIAVSTASAQVQIRLGSAERATYSELHEGLRPGTPPWDSVARVVGATQPAPLWRTVRAALAGRATLNSALLALTRLAELQQPTWADSARRLRTAIAQGEVRATTFDAGDLLESLRAVELERQRAVEGDAAMRDILLARVRVGDYGLADAWVLGRLNAGTRDSLLARFGAATTEEQRVRLLTLLSFAPDTTLIPFFARVYAAPDSAGIPLRYATRASDGLLWIGTRQSLSALRAARERARTRGVYADPKLARGGYDFLQNDSSAVISRTGRWIDEWLERLK